MNELFPTGQWPELLALDWGKNRVAAYLLSGEGKVLAARTELLGVQREPISRFKQTLHTLCGDWLDGNLGMPVIGCNMLGSREGLREIPYAHTPANPAALACKARRFDDLLGRPFAVLPGVCDVSMGRLPDANRGMEVRILGAMDVMGIGEGVFVLPGTHSKWVKVSRGAIETYRTYLTGELFSILRDHSILGELIPSSHPFTLEGFLRGLEYARSGEGEMARKIFSVRSLAVTGSLSPADQLGYLSGLLVGEEVADGLSWTRSRKIILDGSALLAPLYQQALESSGCEVIFAPEHTAAYGLFRLAQEINW